MDRNKTADDALRVAYHDGPPAIAFYGMDWQRGRAQAVTPIQWEGMQLRGDFKEFDFRVDVESKPPSPPAPLPAGEGRTVTKGV